MDGAGADTVSKICSKCSASKPRSAYRPLKRARDGLHGQCRECQAAYRKQHHEKNREHNLATNRAWTAKNYDANRAYQKAWLADNREHHSQYGKEWYARNKDQHNERSRKSYQLNKDKINARAKEWASKNPEKRLEISRRYLSRNLEKCRERSRAWAKANPHVVRAQASKRHAAKLRATPPWLTAEHHRQILEFYEIACWLTAHETPCHVDHIEPLRGKHQCGLHAPWNLQILTAEENIKKGNKMPY